MIKLYGGIALLVILCLTGWAINNWDNNRLAASFNEGVQSERAIWVSAAANAQEKAQQEERAATLASEAVGDLARQQAQAFIKASTAATQATMEMTRNAYESAPPVECRSDAVPRALPDGVLEGLNQARSAALGQAVAASRGLQPAQRRGSAATPDH